jgi:hypothetical protein
VQADGQADNNQNNVKVDSAAVPTQLKITVMAGVPASDLGGETAPADMGTGGGGGTVGNSATDAGAVATTPPANGGPAGNPGSSPKASQHGCSFAGGAGASALPGVLFVLAGILLRRRRAARG